MDDKRTHPNEETVDQQSPGEPPHQTVTDWGELADMIAAGHKITLTHSRNGEVVKVFRFNQEHELPETPPESGEPVVEDVNQEPSPEPKARFVDKVAAVAGSLGAFLRSLTLGNVILFVLYASIGTIFVLLWLVPALVVIVPFLIGMSVLGFAYSVADSIIPNFAGKDLFIMLLFMLIFANVYVYLMRGG